MHPDERAGEGSVLLLISLLDCTVLCCADLFCARLSLSSANTDWDEWECVDVPGLQEGTGKTLGSCAGQIPGGDGFDEPGTAAARAEAARVEEQRQQAERERAAQQAREQEAAAPAQPAAEQQAQ